MTVQTKKAGRQSGTLGGRIGEVASSRHGAWRMGGDLAGSFTAPEALITITGLGYGAPLTEGGPQ